MALNIDQHLHVHALSLKHRSARSSILASNLANADTPGFKARDINFKALMQQGLANPAENVRAKHKHYPLQIGASSGNRLFYRAPTQTSLDRNTVQTDIEKGLFTENAIRYQASLQFLKSRVSGLMKALRAE